MQRKGLDHCDRAAFPQSLHRKPIEQCFVRNQNHPFSLRLRNEQAVERVFVRNGQFSGNSGVAHGNGQFDKALRRDGGFKILRQQRGVGQLANPKLGRNLPMLC